jgi:hypothetical protein
MLKSNCCRCNTLQVYALYVGLLLSALNRLPIKMPAYKGSWEGDGLQMPGLGLAYICQGVSSRTSMDDRECRPHSMTCSNLGGCACTDGDGPCVLSGRHGCSGVQALQATLTCMHLGRELP